MVIIVTIVTVQHSNYGKYCYCTYYTSSIYHGYCGCYITTLNSVIIITIVQHNTAIVVRKQWCNSNSGSNRSDNSNTSSYNSSDNSNISTLVMVVFIYI